MCAARSDRAAQAPRKRAAAPVAAPRKSAATYKETPRGEAQDQARQSARAKSREQAPAKSQVKPRGKPLPGRKEKPVRVAIIGGGCAGMAAAWQLSKLPGYEIDLYEKSWRLGGKGASVRDANGRICEHGLHVWFGFYENAFRMMRECYAEVARQHWGKDGDADGKLVHDSIDDAFFPEPNIGVAERDASNDWSVWTGMLPPAKGLPGETLDADSNPFTLQSYIIRCFDLVRALMVSVIGPPSEDLDPEHRQQRRSSLDEAMDLDFAFDPGRSPTAFIEGIARLVRNSALTTAAGLLQAVTIIENVLHQFNYAPQVADSIVKLMEAVAAQLRKQLRDIVSIDQKLRRKTEILDIVITIAVGLYRDRVLIGTKGFDALNHIDYRQWLLSHGATKSSVVESPFMQGIYDLVFAYRDGDLGRPALAAGVALRGALRMFFTYRGSMFWRMRSGMGDAVFAPLYKALRAGWKVPLDGNNKRDSSPVRFHFLHELTAAKFTFKPRNRRLVRQLTFRLRGDPAKLQDYALDRGGSFPDAKDIKFGAEPAPPQDLTLQVLKDFDAVIFATGFPDLERVFDEALFFEGDNVNDHWRQMRRDQKTVATKSAQVWLNASLEELGWSRGSGIVTSLGLPFQTWADMSHTIPVEARAPAAGAAPGPAPAASVAYFCGVTSEDEVSAYGDDKAPVDGLLNGMLDHGMKDAWPAAFAAGATAARLEIARYVVSNAIDSDRYTLSLPGTIGSRISPLDQSVANMSVAGDWTACGIDAGCVEAAVMSGMLAAHALSGEPALESIVGYDHP